MIDQSQLDLRFHDMVGRLDYAAQNAVRLILLLMTGRSVPPPATKNILAGLDPSKRCVVRTIFFQHLSILLPIAA